MDLLYAGNVEGLRHRLERQRLHAAGDPAAGVGDDRLRARAPQHARALRRGLRPVHLPRPAEPGAARSRRTPSAGGRGARAALPNLKRILSTAISSTSKDDGWSNLGEVGSYLVKSHAAFDPRDYGHTKLGELVRREPYVEVKDVSGPTGLNQLWVRLKPAVRKTARTRSSA